MISVWPEAKSAPSAAKQAISRPFAEEVVAVPSPEAVEVVPEVAKSAMYPLPVAEAKPKPLSSLTPLYVVKLLPTDSLTMLRLNRTSK